MWYNLRMIKRYLLHLLNSDTDFAFSVFNAILRPQLFTLDQKNTYILVLEQDISEKQLEALKNTIPASLTVGLITGGKATLVELTKQ